MDHPNKHIPSWHGVDHSVLKKLANSICHPENPKLDTQDDPLCQRCQKIPFNRLWSGQRFPSPGLRTASERKEYISSKDHAPSPWEIEVMEHLWLVKGCKAIVREKRCALCRTLAAVHRRAHPSCDGSDEQCFLLPVRGDYDFNIESGRLELDSGLKMMSSPVSDKSTFATNIHVLFRTRPPEATMQSANRSNSHFRDERERWIFRLDVQDSVGGRICYNHATASCGSAINWENIKFWLRLCNEDWARYDHERCMRENHLCFEGKECSHLLERDQRLQDPVPFRCIDVETGELVEINLADDHYLALSYIWGQVRVTRREILVGKKLIVEKLPQVIQDAIEASKRLDERYLWVDLVCIDQDDPNDVRKQIARMDLIFRHADITLVAATATDANCSLPGVQTSRPIQEHVLHIDGRRVFCSMLTNDYGPIVRSNWARRGWTFQEALLSCRCLYFLDSEAVLGCKQAMGFESLDPTGPFSLGANPEINLTWMSDDLTLRWNFFNYEELVDRYLRRTLTFESDIMSAFAGVVAWLHDRYGVEFIQALPFEEPVTSLMWTFKEDITQSARRNMFPSWTWMEWQGEVGYDQIINVYRGETSMSGPEGSDTLKLLRQATIEPDRADPVVQKLRITTDVRQFKLVPGPPKLTLSEREEKYLQDLAETNPEEAEECRKQFWQWYEGPMEHQFDHHLINENGKIVYPQSMRPEDYKIIPYEFSSADIVYQEIHLGHWMDGEASICHFIMLAHVTDPDPDPPLSSSGANDDLGEIEEMGEEAETIDKPTGSTKWDHVVTLLVRKRHDGMFERVDVFTFKAEDWFSGFQVYDDEPIVLV